MGFFNKFWKWLTVSLAGLVGLLALMLGLTKGQQRKRKAKQLRRALERADNEKKNELYVKKIRIGRAVDDINRMFGTKGSNGSADTDTKH